MSGKLQISVTLNLRKNYDFTSPLTLSDLQCKTYASHLGGVQGLCLIPYPRCPGTRSPTWQILNGTRTSDKEKSKFNATECWSDQLHCSFFRCKARGSNLWEVKIIFLELVRLPQLVLCSSSVPKRWLYWWMQINLQAARSFLEALCSEVGAVSPGAIEIGGSPLSLGTCFPLISSIRHYPLFLFWPQRWLMAGLAVSGPEVESVNLQLLIRALF